MGTGRVNPGDRLKGIPASDWNRFLQLTDDAEGGGRLPGDSHPEAHYPLLIAVVKNDSGANRSRFDAVGLNAPLVTPAQRLVEFKRQPSFSAVVPVPGTHDNRIGILLEPVRSGKLAPVAVSGVVPCPMTSSITGFSGWAEIQSGSCQLKEAGWGTVQVLWAESSGSPRWAYVRLGNGEPMRFFRPSGAASGGLYPGDLVVKDAAGTVTVVKANVKAVQA